MHESLRSQDPQPPQLKPQLAAWVVEALTDPRPLRVRLGNTDEPSRVDGSGEADDVTTSSVEGER